MNARLEEPSHEAARITAWTNCRKMPERQTDEWRRLSAPADGLTPSPSSDSRTRRARVRKQRNARRQPKGSAASSFSASSS
jgi:hypothetical protein